jgi:hypothetical protein
VGSVAVQDRSVASSDLARVVKHDDLGSESIDLAGRVVGGISSHITTFDVLVTQSHVETNIVAWDGLIDLCVVHLNRLNL